ncbi:MAG TPA: NUDIX hydrolase [Polyangiaceae bacterium]|jgi:ADP-ribose pyrophosphatase|nr:NUDIX hydrolase [Polyangiaceae bacterium]
MPELPDSRLEQIEGPQIDGTPGFLWVVRRKLRVRHADGRTSSTFVYDEVARASLDAVVLVPHFFSQGERFVYLRSALRPPMAFRRHYLDNVGKAQGLWELPAGMIEPSEESEAGVLRCAARELHEELGFQVGLDQLRALGPSTFPSPGVLAERHFFFSVEVEPSEQQEPALDGSALEEAGVVIAVSLRQALDWCRNGEIEDAKTELGLRRLSEVV